MPTTLQSSPSTDSARFSSAAQVPEQDATELSVTQIQWQRPFALPLLQLLTMSRDGGDGGGGWGVGREERGKKVDGERRGDRERSARGGGREGARGVGGGGEKGRGVGGGAGEKERMGR